MINLELNDAMESRLLSADDPLLPMALVKLLAELKRRDNKIGVISKRCRVSLTILFLGL